MLNVLFKQIAKLSCVVLYLKTHIFFYILYRILNSKFLCILFFNLGVAWGCKWVYEENGVWKETCYCEDRDGCNGASTLIHSALALTIGTLFIVLQRLL